jgi:hypothetical protein
MIREGDWQPFDIAKIERWSSRLLKYFPDRVNELGFEAL